MSYLELASWFGSLDGFKGSRQFPLESECQEIDSFVTEYGFYTPTRLIQTSTDSAHAFQAGMMEIFDGMVYVSLLIWIDDTLLFAKAFEDCLQVFRQSFQRLRKFNVKLNPNKTQLFSREITWCGRKVSKIGIRFHDTPIQAFQQLPEPTTADQMQKLVCAANWIRTTIPRYAEAVSLLQKFLKSLQNEAGSMKQSKLKKLVIAERWTDEHNQCFQDLKRIIPNTVTLAHPNPEHEVCLFTEASDKHRGLVVTQVRPEDTGQRLAIQRHQPLAIGK